MYLYITLTINDSCCIICSGFNCITVASAIKERVNFVAGGCWIWEWLVWSTGCVERWPEAERLVTSQLQGRVLDCVNGRRMDFSLDFISKLTDWRLLLAAGLLQSAFTVVSGMGMRQPSVAGCSWHTACMMGLGRRVTLHFTGNPYIMFTLYTPSNEHQSPLDPMGEQV